MHLPSRSVLLLGLIVVLLATVPVLIPLLVTAGGTTGAGPVALVGSPVAPALTGVPGRPATTEPAPRPAGALAPVTAAPTPSATPTTTTTAPTPPPGAPAPPAPAGPTSAAPDPTPSATTPSPTVLLAGADLTVMSVSWSPAEPTAGQPVVFSAVVRNAGTDPTPDRTHGVAFSVDGTKVTWSAGSTAPLAPGEERTYTADGGDAGNAWTAATGEHTVQAWADDANRIPESDETNNTTTATVTVE